MRTIAVIRRIFQEMLRDKRTLALLFVAPLLILSLMYLLFNSDAPLPRLGVVNVDDTVVDKLEGEDIVVIRYAQATETTIVEEDLDGLLVVEDGTYTLTLKNDEPTIAKPLQAKITQTVSSEAMSSLIRNNLGEQAPLFDLSDMQLGISTSYVYGDSETVFFDVLMPILIGFFVFFFVFLISGVGLLKERTSGTLERLLTTPIKRGEIVVAYLTGFGIFAIIQTLIVVFFAISVLDLNVEGAIWHVVLINVIVALVALSLGILLSSFAASEFQMVQFIPVIVIPQIFFTGIIPLDSMAEWLQAIAKVMPMYYAADALKKVMYQGLGLGDIKWDLVVLLSFAAIFIVLNVHALKKYRKL